MIQMHKPGGTKERYEEMRKREKISHRKEKKAFFEKQFYGLINDNAIW